MPSQTVILTRQLKPRGALPPSAMKLSCCDGLIATTVFANAWAWQGAGSVDSGVLEQALQALVDDLPFLGGRLHCMEGHKLGSMHIMHDGPGLAFLEVDSSHVKLADIGPHTWGQQRITLASPGVPFWMGQLETGPKALKGCGPLAKVQLTRLQDGDILSLTVSHALTDLLRFPSLSTHLAAHYRQFAAGGAEAPSGPPSAEGSTMSTAMTNHGSLLCPGERTLMASEHMARLLLGEGASSWQPPKLNLKTSLAGYWRLMCRLIALGRNKMELVVLHIPQHRMQALKRLAGGGASSHDNGEEVDSAGNTVTTSGSSNSRVPEGSMRSSPITTGDAVQAACALLLHAAYGLPLLPVHPAEMAAVVQLPTPPGYSLGNATHLLPVCLPSGTQQPEESPGGHEAALRLLAGAIRGATLAFRGSSEAQLEALRLQEQLTSMPALKTLAVWNSLPQYSSITNYVPRLEDPDFGIGTPLFTCHVITPAAQYMAAVRPAPTPTPFCGGLLAQLHLPPKCAARLRAHPLLMALLPEHGEAFQG